MTLVKVEQFGQRAQFIHPSFEIETPSINNFLNVWHLFLQTNIADKLLFIFLKAYEVAVVESTVTKLTICSCEYLIQSKWDLISPIFLKRTNYVWRLSFIILQMKSQEVYQCLKLSIREFDWIESYQLMDYSQNRYLALLYCPELISIALHHL